MTIILVLLAVESSSGCRERAVRIDAARRGWGLHRAYDISPLRRAKRWRVLKDSRPQHRVSSRKFCGRHVSVRCPRPSGGNPQNLRGFVVGTSHFQPGSEMSPSSSIRIVPDRSQRPRQENCGVVGESVRTRGSYLLCRSSGLSTYPHDLSFHIWHQSLQGFSTSVRKGDQRSILVSFLWKMLPWVCMIDVCE